MQPCMKPYVSSAGCEEIERFRSFDRSFHRITASERVKLGSMNRSILVVAILLKSRDVMRIIRVNRGETPVWIRSIVSIGLLDSTAVTLRECPCWFSQSSGKMAIERGSSP